jgi:hypothetical protein
MKCANCSNDAAWIYEPSEGQEIAYCIQDVPGFLIPRMKAGHLKKVESFEALKKDAIDALPKVEPVIEEPIVEEDTAPTTKKVVKKTSAVEPDVK